MLILGLSILLNVVVLTVGLLWFKRQGRRVTTEREAKRRRFFEVASPPGVGQRVVEDNRGRLAEAEAIYLPHVGWIDGASLLRIEDDVLGWRPLPE